MTPILLVGEIGAFRYSVTTVGLLLGSAKDSSFLVALNIRTKAYGYLLTTPLVRELLSTVLFIRKTPRSETLQLLLHLNTLTYIAITVGIRVATAIPLLATVARTLLGSAAGVSIIPFFVLKAFKSFG